MWFGSRRGCLSIEWATIVRTYAKIGTLHLTYSPLNQHSSTVAGSALDAAGIPIPFSSDTQFAPAVFTDLTRYERDRLVSGATRPAADPLPFWGRNSSATAQATEPHRCRSRRPQRGVKLASQAFMLASTAGLPRTMWP